MINFFKNSGRQKTCPNCTQVTAAVRVGTSVPHLDHQATNDHQVNLSGAMHPVPYHLVQFLILIQMLVLKSDKF